MESWIEKVEGRSVLTKCNLREFDGDFEGKILTHGYANMVILPKDRFNLSKL